MKYFLTTLTIALIAMAQVHGYSSGGNSYGSGGSNFGSGGSSFGSQSSGADAAAGGFQLQGVNGAGADGSNGASASAQANAGDNAGGSSSSFGSNQNIPYTAQNTRGNSVSSSITYPNNKGEILIHRPAAIIVKRPPTKVLVNHPPLVVKPAPVVLHKPPAVVLRKVFVKHHPRPVKVEPVYVNVVKPPAEKYFVNEKQQQFAAPQPASFAPLNIGGAGGFAPGSGPFSPSSAATFVPIGSTGAGASAVAGSGLGGFGGPAGFGSGSGVDSAALSKAGYQLLQGNQDLAALANIAGTGSYGAHSGAAPSSYSAPSY